MIFKEIEIAGYRGFQTRQKLVLGQPNGSDGSGLTTVVGPNNSGKSTIFESFRALNYHYQTPSFTEGKRNKLFGDKIEIKIVNTLNQEAVLKTTSQGGSETELVCSTGLTKQSIKIFTLPSRRTFAPYFNKMIWDRDMYLVNTSVPAVRGERLQAFESRLFEIQKEPFEYNKVLHDVLGYIPSWCIDQSDVGQYYIKFNSNGQFYNSDGTGEGLVSIFTIVDALYDSNAGDMIVIDEPELSLHPALQKKLLKVFLKYSKDRQIVIFTHSPFMISWDSLKNGGKIARTVKESDGTKIYKPEQCTIDNLLPLLDNLNNPHILGLNAKEVFFLDDNVILTEGQEDVIFYRRIMEIEKLEVNADFYGWGVGGATNSDKILHLLKDLGFKKVAVLLDNDKKEELEKKIKDAFESYGLHFIPTNDVRDKKAVGAKEAKIGLIDKDGTEVHPEHKEEIIKIFEDLNKYFS